MSAYNPAHEIAQLDAMIDRIQAVLPLFLATELDLEASIARFTLDVLHFRRCLYVENTQLIAQFVSLGAKSARGQNADLTDLRGFLDATSKSASASVQFINSRAKLQAILDLNPTNKE